MTPVSQPQKDIVTARIEEQEWNVGKAQDPQTVRQVRYSFAVASRSTGIPRIGLYRPESSCAQYDIDGYQIDDEESLATRWHVKQVSDRRLVARAEHRWINAPSIEFGDQYHWKRKES